MYEVFLWRLYAQDVLCCLKMCNKQKLDLTWFKLHVLPGELVTAATADGDIFQHLTSFWIPLSNAARPSVAQWWDAIVTKIITRIGFNWACFREPGLTCNSWNALAKEKRKYWLEFPDCWWNASAVRVLSSRMHLVWAAVRCNSCILESWFAEDGGWLAWCVLCSSSSGGGTVTRLITFAAYCESLE